MIKEKGVCLQVNKSSTQGRMCLPGHYDWKLYSSFSDALRQSTESLIVQQSRPQPPLGTPPPDHELHSFKASISSRSWLSSLQPKTPAPTPHERETIKQTWMQKEDGRRTC
jgi:hypothetical protein